MTAPSELTWPPAPGTSTRPRAEHLYGRLRAAVEGEASGRAPAPWYHRPRPKSALILGAGTAALLGLLTVPSEVAPVLGLATVLGVTFAPAFLAVGHALSHVPSTRSGHADRALAAIGLLGVSPWFWRAKHNGVHHGGVPGRDRLGDEPPALGSLARLSTNQPWRRWHRWQVFYVPPLMPFVLGATLVESLVANLTGRVGGRQVRPTGWQAAGRRVVAQLAAPVVVTAALVAAHGPLLAGAAIAASFTVGGALVAAVLAPEIAHQGSTDELVAGRGGDAWVRWHLHVAMSTDVHPVVRWAIGSVNLHAEHHLFPRLPVHELDATTPVVAAFAALEGLPFHRYGSIRASWQDFVLHLRRLGISPPR